MSAPKKRGRKKLTPWFDGSLTPARPGVYQRMTESGPLYAMWTGGEWRCGRVLAHKAAETVPKSIWQTALRWRGLAEQP